MLVVTPMTCDVIVYVYVFKEAFRDALMSHKL